MARGETGADGGDARMTLSPLGKYALRSLTRHSRRTLLSVLGIGIGCVVALIATAYIRGEGDLIERAAALSGTGHLRLRLAPPAR